MSGKTVAAVVVTYNRLALLQQCIAHLKAQTVPCDILLIDNASTDGTGAWAAGQKEIQYYNTGANLGGAGGFNIGMRRAVESGYDYVWVMDDDTLPNPDALEKLLEADEILGGDYGWLSSKCLWTDGNICPMNLQRTSPYRDAHISRDSKKTIPVQMASFVSLFLPRETLLIHGLPISDFFIWSDDWEFTRRVSRKKPCYAVTQSSVIHAMKSNTVVNIASDSMDRLPRYFYAYRNDVYLYRREGLKGWAWLLAKDCWHCMQVLLCGDKNKAKKLNIIVKGFRDGTKFYPEIELALCNLADLETQKESK